MHVNIDIQDRTNVDQKIYIEARDNKRISRFYQIVGAIGLAPSICWNLCYFHGVFLQISTADRINFIDVSMVTVLNSLVVGTYTALAEDGNSSVIFKKTLQNTIKNVLKIAIVSLSINSFLLGPSPR